MELAPFVLDQWLNQRFAHRIQFDLASSTGPEWTLQGLLDLLNADQKQQFFNTKIDYSDATGNRVLREAVAKFSQVDTDDVQILTGGSEGLVILFFLAATPGANVVLPFPCFPPVIELAKSFGLEVRLYSLKTENQFEISRDDILNLADRNTKLIFINTPHNPTGTVTPQEDLLQIHDYCAEREIQFVVDEVYHPIYHSKSSPSSASRLRHATILSDFSKALCLSGLRIGWLIDRNHTRLEKYLNCRSYFTVSNSPLTELLAAFALEHSETILSNAARVVRNNMKVLDQFFAVNEEFVRWIRPQGGTVSFPWLTSLKNARPFCERLLQKGVLLVPGDCFGMPAHFRLGFGATSKEIQPGLNLISAELRNF